MLKLIGIELRVSFQLQPSVHYLRQSCGIDLNQILTIVVPFISEVFVGVLNRQMDDRYRHHLLELLAQL